MIIIAILGLLILVVLAFVFSSKINLFGKGVSNCAGTCEYMNGHTPSETCELKSSDIKTLTYNPTGSCSQNTKTSTTYACCIVAYTQ